MTLWELSKQSQALILRLNLEGLDESHPENSLADLSFQRLSSLGFLSQKTVTCLQTTFFGGPRVYQIEDHVFSLSKEIAQKVEIEPLKATKEAFSPVSPQITTALPGLSQQISASGFKSTPAKGKE